MISVTAPKYSLLASATAAPTDFASAEVSCGENSTPNGEPAKAPAIPTMSTSISKIMHAKAPIPAFFAMETPALTSFFSAFVSAACYFSIIEDRQSSCYNKL